MFTYTPGWQEAFLWVVITAFIVAFILSFSMGGNDCANSYGTSVGSKVLKLWHAYILATVFETLGAGLLGYKVTDTIRKNIVTVSMYSVHSQQTVNNTWEIVDFCPNDTEFGTTTTTSVFDEDFVSGNMTDMKLPCHEYTSVQFMLGALGSLGGCAVWLLIATLLHLPVSTTHSAVGATVGFSMVLKGGNGINWYTIAKIVISWVASPVLAGFFATLFYAVIKYVILNKRDPLEASLTFLPFIFMISLTCNLFSVSYQGSKYLHLHDIPWWIVLLASLSVGVTVALFIRLCVTNRLRRWVLTKHAIPGLESKSQVTLANDCSDNASYIDLTKNESSIPLTVLRNESELELEVRVTERDSGIIVTPACTGNASVRSGSNSRHSPFIPDTKDSTARLTGPDQNRLGVDLVAVGKGPESVDPISLKQKLIALKHPVEEHPHVSKVFSSLQVMSACFMSFSHGSNDTANAIGLLVAVWFTFKDGNAFRGDSSDVELEGLILFGAAGMIVGLWALGHKVIQTVGQDITKITPCSGFCMELGTSFTVLFASKIGIPVSTTHCLVGAVVCVGWFKTRQGVSWGTFRNITLSWMVTLPVTGALAAFFAWLLQFAVL